MTIRKQHFTLVELLVAMAVFSIMMLTMMQFYSQTQSLWNRLSAKTETFENARIAMNMINTDLDTLSYSNGQTRTCLRWIEDTKVCRLCFGTIRSDFLNEKCRTKVVNVTYRWCKEKINDDIPAYSLQVASVGDHKADGTEDGDWRMLTDAQPFKTPDPLLDSKYITIIEGVASFKIKALTLDATPQYVNMDLTEEKPQVPACILLEMELVDSITLEKWNSASDNKSLITVYEAMKTQPESEAADVVLFKNIVKPRLQKFSRMIVISKGDHVIN